MNKKKLIILVIMASVLLIAGIVLNAVSNPDNSKPNNITENPNQTPTPTPDENNEVEDSNLVAGFYDCTVEDKQLPVDEISGNTFIVKETYSFSYTEDKIKSALLIFEFAFQDKEAFDNYNYQVVDPNREITLTEDVNTLTKKVTQFLILNVDNVTEENFNVDNYVVGLTAKGYTCTKVASEE